ncbi:hypothetical protein HMPREF1363_02773, partial [Enterococcus faecium ERV161]
SKSLVSKSKLWLTFERVSVIFEKDAAIGLITNKIKETIAVIDPAIIPHSPKLIM